MCQFIRAREDKPHVLLLQETLLEGITLSGYETFCHRQDDGRGIAVCVSKQISALVHHDLDKRFKSEYQCIELLPGRRLLKGLLILHVYSSPKRSQDRFYALISKAMRLANHGGIPLLVCGDFNAPHTAWGYPKTTRKNYTLQEHT